MHVLFRVDGGPDIGYGHLIRSNALAEELINTDHRVSVATTNPSPARSVFPGSIDILELLSREDPEPFITLFDSVTPDVVFMDAYPVNTEYQRTIRDRVSCAVLQDDARHAICADLFVNGNLYADALEYQFAAEKPRVCLGTDYALLRREIRERIPDDPLCRESPKHAIVTMGGSDIAGLTPTVIRAFDSFDLLVDVIVGPGFSTQQERAIRKTAKDCSTNISISRDPDDLVERMVWADFAVSTASSTTYELLALGTPIVSIPVVDNQEPIAKALKDRDAATVLPRGANKTQFRNAIQQYLRDPELRQTRQRRGMELVDGKGAERVCNEVLSIAA